MGIPWEWEHKYAKNGNGNGKSIHDNGNGNGYFFMCANIPMGRLDANLAPDSVNSLLFLNSNM